MTEWSAEKVLTVLRGSALREPAHAWLFNVRNATGFTRRERYADAIVISLWPSRGIWIAGIEVKISRNDWLRELDKPDKSAEIQRFCNHWWVAAPEGVVTPAEIPATWGHYLVLASGKQRVRTVKAAPKLKPEPLTLDFVASVLRNQADSAGRLRQMGYHEGHRAAREEFDGNKIEALQDRLHEAESAKKRAEQQLSYSESALKGLKQTIAAFERDAGLEIHLETYHGGGWTPNSLGKQFAAARLLSEMDAQALGERFLEVGRALQSVADLTKGTGT